MDAWFKKLRELEPKGEWVGCPKSMRKAMEFSTDEAMRKYLKDHPRADKRRHKVVKTPSKGIEKDETEDEHEGVFGKHVRKTEFTLEDYNENKHFGDQMGEGRFAANHAFYSAKEYPDSVLDMRFGKDGRMNGIMSTHERDNGDLEIDGIASSGRVHWMGSFMMAGAIRQRLRKGKNLVLKSVPAAEPFYQHIGMKKGKKNEYMAHDYSFTYEEAVRFSNHVYDTLSEESMRKAASSLLTLAREMIGVVDSGMTIHG